MMQDGQSGLIAPGADHDKQEGAAWAVKSVDRDQVETLARSLAVHQAIAHILWNRQNKTLEAAKSFLSPTLREGLPHPYLIKGMRDATQAILDAIQQERRICVWGDYDVDGTTGASALTLFLREMGANVLTYVPHRIDEGYGLNENAIRVLAGKGVKLLITVDCGISNFHEILLAKGLGLSTIVVDHHLVPEPRPPALAILNPHQSDCEFPAKELSGAGLAFYLLLGLGVASKERGRAVSTPDPRPYLDIVTLGTIADMVPLCGVNRVLVKRGLIELSRTTRPGLVALKEVSGLGDQAMRAGHVGFQLGPRINAAGRVSVGAKVVELLTTDSQETARGLAQELDDNNRTRQRIEMEVLSEAIQSAAVGSQSAIAVVLGSASWHPGVLGIVCSRILERFHRPTVLVGFSNGLGKGSARSVPGLSIVEAFRHCEDLLEKYGGHEMAGGLTVREELFPIFAERFASHVESMLPAGPIMPPLIIDALLDFRDIERRLITELEMLAPFGIGNPEPVFASRGVTVKEWKEVGDRHLKLQLIQDDRKLDAIAFRMARPPWLESNSLVNVAYRIATDQFRGTERVQLKVLDLKPVPQVPGSRGHAP